MARGTLTPSIVTWDDVTSAEDTYPDSDPGFFNIKILSEGDSWFTVGGLPVSNILYQLCFHEPAIIVNLAFPGDTMIHISRLSKNPQLKEALGRHSFAWDAILLSGGGNDLVDHADDILLMPDQRQDIRMPNVADYCDTDKFADLITRIQQGFRDIAELRDKEGGSANKVCIITHTYAYATPRNSPSRFFGLRLAGPWIQPAFDRNQIPEQDRMALSDYLVDTLAEGHLALVGEIEHFFVADTRRSLTRAAKGAVGNSGDWLNEFHPNSTGYGKVARAIEPVLMKAINRR